MSEEKEKEIIVTFEKFTEVTKEPRKGGGHPKKSEPILAPITKESDK